MSELWLLRGSYWSFPITVTWHDVLGEVTLGAGLPLLKSQVKVASTFLKEISQHEVDGKLFVLKTVLEAHGEPSTADPEDLVEWVPSRKNKEVQGYVIPEEFLNEFCKSGYCPIKDPLLMDIVWLGLCKWMLHWVAVLNRPIDLYFARLVPLQLRKNWAPLLVKFENAEVDDKINPSYGKIAQKFSPNARSMIQRGICGMALRHEMTSVIKMNKCWSSQYRQPILDWTLEVITQGPWDEMIERVETLRQSKYRHGNYNSDVRRQMKRQLPDVLLAYAHYLEKTSQPTCRLLRVQPDRITGKLAPIVPGEHKGFHLTHSFDIDEPALADCDGPVPSGCAGEEGGEEDVESQDETLPPLPDLQPCEENVRNGG